MREQPNTPVQVRKLIKPWLIGIAVCVLLVLFISTNAQANIWCTWFLQCIYRSPGFKVRVVDKDTGKPIADVHALAVWLQIGIYGQYPSLMAQDAVSGEDGWLVFPPWGPMRGSSVNGLVIGHDPEITLYKIGYGVTQLPNRSGAEEHDRVRGFGDDGQTFTMSEFRGSFEERDKQLFLAYGRAAPVYRDSIALFGQPYLNRWKRIRAEMELQPDKYKDRLFLIERAMKMTPIEDLKP